MRGLAFILGLALCVGSAARAETSNFVIGLSPFLDSAAKDPVYRGLVRLIVEDFPLGARVEIYDAYNLKSIARLSIPTAQVFKSPKTRANQFASSIGEIRQFLARDNPKPAGPKPNFDGAIRLPQFCDFLAQTQPTLDGEEKLPLLLIGSPLYQDAREPDFSMTGGYFPSDGHLRASREESVFGLNPGDASAGRPRIYWAYFGDPWVNDLHREKVERFWALYAERRGGRLASFSSDLATAMAAFGAQSSGASAASNGWAADPLQAKPEMVRVTRTVQQVDWLTGDAMSDANPPPPSRMKGPLKIGIRWKEDIDLDLYAIPRPGAETLFFQHQRSPEGYYFTDHRSSPGRDYEYIEFESPVDVRDARSFVNFYAGTRTGGPRGEVRIEYLNRIYRGTFAIASSEGNQGRSGKSQAGCWTEIPIREILRIPEAAAEGGL
ncbi:MAG TPA: hypothetical protein VGO59_09805 [Verrucomicrobiae bacterium]